MRSFALVALVATAGAEAFQYGAAVDSVWKPTLAARDDCPKPTSMCTAPVVMDGATTTLTYQCASKSQSTTHVTVTQTMTVTASSSAAAPPNKGPAEPPAELSITNTVFSTQTRYTTVTKTVQRPSGNGTSTYLPSASTGLPVYRNGTSIGFASPSLPNHRETSKPSYTGTPFTGGAGQTGVGAAALVLGLVVALQLA